MTTFCKSLEEYLKSKIVFDQETVIDVEFLHYYRFYMLYLLNNLFILTIILEAIWMISTKIKCSRIFHDTVAIILILLYKFN